jgi:hemolysin activation/secretion protein
MKIVFPRRLHRSGLTALLFVVIHGSRLAVHAQTPPAVDAAAQAAERQQREEQDRLREQFRRDRERAQAPVIESGEVPLPQIVAPQIARREIRELQITGADHMRPAFRTRLLKEFEGRSIGVEDLERLLTQITSHYVLRGFVTTRAYVPDQDLSTGTLTIHVLEGRLEQIEGSAGAGNIFPAAPGELLNLRDLEQGIDNLNRLPSHEAKLDLLPGSAPGGTIVRVNDTRTRPWRLSFSADNTGTETTGRNQASATLAFDDLLGFGESVSLTHRRAVPYRSGREASESTSFSFSAPWGYQSFTLGGSASSYAMQFAAPSGLDLPFTGDSRSLFLRTDRVLYRGRTGRLGVYANLTWRSSKNYLMNSLIDVSSRDTVALDVGANYSTALAGGFASIDASLSRGLPIFGGAEDPAGLPDYLPRSEYTALKMNASWSRGFVFADVPFAFSSSFSAQVTRDVLYGADQLTIGGLYAVRGFDRTNLAGDVGYVWRKELSHTLLLAKDTQGRARLSLRPYVALDQGYAWSNYSSAFSGTLVGSAVGVAFTAGRYNAEVFHARSIDQAAHMDRETGRTYFRFNASF